MQNARNATIKQTLTGLLVIPGLESALLYEMHMTVSNLLKKPLFGLYGALQLPCNMLLSILQGDVAQLGERDNRTVEVRGSSPLISTATKHHYF